MKVGHLPQIMEKDEKTETHANRERAEKFEKDENGEFPEETPDVPRTPSVNSEGVHDLCLYKQYLNSPSKLRATGIYQKLKADTFVKEPLFENALDSYDLSFIPARKFFEFCSDSKKQGFPINPYPILH